MNDYHECIQKPHILDKILILMHTPEFSTVVYIQIHLINKYLGLTGKMAG